MKYFKRNRDNDLRMFAADYPEFHNTWRKFPYLRNSMKEILIERLTNQNFSIKEFSRLFETNKINAQSRMKILFAHFSPFLFEVEGLGLPIYFKKMHPNCTVDFTYDKGGTNSFNFRINNSLETIDRIDKIENKYDIIVARSSALKNMMARKNQRDIVKSSKFKINIKTMSYQPNYVYADFYFKEDDMSPPVNPYYEIGVTEYLKKFKKKDLIVVPGTIKHAKGQLTMIQNLQKQSLGNNKLVFLGKIEDFRHEQAIRNICKEKEIEYYMPGFLNRQVSDFIKNMARVSIFNFQPTLIHSGYPRSLGESIASKNYAIITDKIVVPDYFKKCVLTYEKNNFKKMNEKIKFAVNRTSDDNFFKEFNQDVNFSDYCYNTINKILKIYNNI